MKYITGALCNSELSTREEENRKIAYDAALESIVLLKNDNNILPLKPCRIALFGAGASLTIKGGTGSGEVNERYSVSILEGLREAGFDITTLDYLKEVEEEYEKNKLKYMQEFRQMNLTEMFNAMNTLENVPFPIGREITREEIENSNTETAIYVVARQAGEGHDRRIEKNEFDLDPIEIRNIKKLSLAYKNFILVINSGSYMNLSSVDGTTIPCLIYYCQQGTEGGNAFADLLVGKVSPSGKLTDTWVRKYEDIPFSDEYSYLAGDKKEEFYKEGIYVGYRYFDTFRVEPRYHFGYGLSYTKFSYRVLNQQIVGDSFSIDVEVTNIGEYPGKDVVQVYVSCPQGKLPKEYQRLVAFNKTRLLNPGDKDLINLNFRMSYCSSYDASMGLTLLEKGLYIVRLGNSSNSTQVISYIELNTLSIIAKHKNICPIGDHDFKEIEPVIRQTEINDKVIRIPYSRKKRTSEFFYSTPSIYHDRNIDKILKKMNYRNMIDVIVGTGFKGMFNTTNMVCPGSVGMTTDKFIKKGLINVHLADGPAGLRLIKRSAITNHMFLKFRQLDFQMGFMEYFPEFIKNRLKPSAKDTILYQFTTAFPVGTALAQTWNVSLCKEVGRAISREMSEYKVTYWLGPAMNIHRNPLCGRNFEYFSEDPILTGKIAASLCLGVQETEGNYATIKHFACNNQEENRNKSSSNVHERALREIYLKGFEIAVKEGQAKAVMTSYNLINGVYTANSYDLVTSVLRNEWGFNGLVMTDWYATGKEMGTKIQLGSDYLALKAGNDMIMPGGRAHKKELRRALRKDLITKEDVHRACANIVKQILESKVSQENIDELRIK